MNRTRKIAGICLLALGISTAGCRPGQASNSPYPPLLPTIASTPQPGLRLRGNVHWEDGRGLAGVNILLGLASYPGRTVALTDPNGNYQSEAIFIPGDEMIRVWAEMDGFAIVPEKGSSAPGEYFWRHYYGFEDRKLDFIVRLSP